MTNKHKKVVKRRIEWLEKRTAIEPLSYDRAELSALKDLISRKEVECNCGSLPVRIV